MEFTYRISEDDYVQASKMARKVAQKSIWKTIAFWAFVVICLTLLFSVVSKISHQSDASNVESSETQIAPVSDSETSSHLWANLSPLCIIIVIWIGIFLFWIPYQVRRAYRRDTNAHGEFTVSVDSQSIAIRSTAGASLQSGWNVFKEWREDEGIILLQYPSKTHQIVNVKDLSEIQHEELHSILTAALPKK